MFKAIRTRISSAHILAVTAIVLAAGGSAIAATKISTKNLARNAVTAPKIATDAVKKAKVKTGAIGADELGTIEYRTAVVDLSVGGPPAGGDGQARCMTSEKLIGGGATIEGEDNVQDPDVAVVESGPSTDKTSWVARGVDNDAPAAKMTITALCLKK